MNRTLFHLGTPNRFQFKCLTARKRNIAAGVLEAAKIALELNAIVDAENAVQA